MSEENLDALLGRMPAIAEAVNAFTSEAVQQAAFDALVAAFHGHTKLRNPSPPDEHGRPHNEAVEPPPRASTDDGESKPGQAKKQGRKRNSGGGKDFQLVKDLNLRPEGKPSFSEFIAEKQPTSNEDKYAVAVYYLQYVLEIEGITTNHVGSVFRLEQSWREPGSLLTGLRMTASRKGTVDTSAWDNLRVTPHGRNLVEHDLPRPAKAKK